MNEFTEKEKETLSKFRMQLTDLNLEGDWNEDWFLIKWLRARDLSIYKAEFMLREHIKFRAKYNIDEIEKWEAPEVFPRIFPTLICGFSKKGCPVWVCPSKYIDINEFWEKCEPEAHMLYGVQKLESSIKLMKEKSTPDNPVTEAIIIADLEGFNMRSIMSRAFMERAQKTATQLTDNYPELVHRAYFLNSPRIFTALFSFFKHILPKKTLEKFEIHGSDREKWIPTLLEHIDPEVLLPMYGGTNVEVEQTAFVGLIPASEKYSSQHRSSIDDRFSYVKVLAGKKHHIDYHIETPKSLLSWSFKTIEYDISFALIYESEEEIIPNTRVDSAKKKQVGNILCERTGKYTLVFDNTYSRMRSKSLHFYVDVEDLNVTTNLEKCKINENGAIAIAEATTCSG